MRSRIVAWIGLAAAGCGPQVAIPAETDGSESGSGPSSTTASSTTASSTTASSTTAGSTTAPSTTTTATTGPSTSTTVDPSTTTDVESSSGPIVEESSEDGCATSECAEDRDCANGAICIACICIGGCDPEGPGVYGDCLLPDGTEDLAACEYDEALCLFAGNEPSLAVCSTPCAETCDCAPAPDGYEDQLACEDITGDGVGDCYIACGEECPPGMVCIAGEICGWGP